MKKLVAQARENLQAHSGFGETPRTANGDACAVNLAKGRSALEERKTIVELDCMESSPEVQRASNAAEVAERVAW